MTQRILIIKLGAFGDIIMAEGLMRCLRAHHAQDHITLLTEPFYAKFLKNAPHFDAFITDPRAPRWQLHKLYATRRHLRSQSFDIVYDLQKSPRSRLYTKWLAPAKIYCDDKDNIRKENPSLSGRDILARQLEAAGVDISGGYLPDLRWAAAPQTTIEPIIKEAGLTNGFVLLLAGSSARNANKRWGGYAELAQLLTAAQIPCATAPGPDEMELCQKIPAPMLLDNGKPLSFAQMLALAPYCRYVVGNDTGPTHLMAYAKTKGLALFDIRLHLPEATGIQDFYDVIAVEDLQTLPVAQVFAKVQAAYSNSV